MQNSSAFKEILDTLLMPVFNRVFHFLKMDITGTDDTIEHSSLRRGYFSLILAIASGELEPVLYSQSQSRSSSLVAVLMFLFAQRISLISRTFCKASCITSETTRCRRIKKLDSSC